MRGPEGPMGPEGPVGRAGKDYDPKDLDKLQIQINDIKAHYANMETSLKAIDEMRDVYFKMLARLSKVEKKIVFMDDTEKVLVKDVHALQDATPTPAPREVLPGEAMLAKKSKTTPLTQKSAPLSEASKVAVQKQAVAPKASSLLESSAEIHVIKKRSKKSARLAEVTAAARRAKQESSLLESMASVSAQATMEAVQNEVVSNVEEFDPTVHAILKEYPELLEKLSEAGDIDLSATLE